MKAKPWQIAVIVLGLLVGVGSIVWSLSGERETGIPESYLVVNVETGQIYRVDADRSLVLPARDPETGKAALVRIARDESGRLAVTRRDLAQLRHLDQGVRVTAIDPESGELTVPPAEPRPLPAS